MTEERQTSLLSELEVVKREIETQKGLLSDARVKCESAKKQVADIEGGKTDDSGRLVSIEKQLKDATSDVLELGKKLQTLESEKSELSQKLSKVFGLAFGKKKELSDQIDKKSAEISSLKKHIDEARQLRDSATSEIENQKNIVERQRQAALSLFGVCEREVSDIERRIKELEGKIDSINAEIEALRKLDEEEKRAEEATRLEEERKKIEIELAMQEAEAQKAKENTESEIVLESEDSDETTEEYEEELEDYELSDEDEDSDDAEELEDEYYYRDPVDCAAFNQTVEETISEVNSLDKMSEASKYEKLESIDSDFTVGKIVRFGNYRQGKLGEVRPLEWLVLERKGNGVKLLSLKGIETLPYNGEDGNTNWGECFLRHWLNEKFYNAAFSEAEAKSILLTDIEAIRHPKYTTNPGRNTKDKVFILNYQEADELTKHKLLYLTEWAVEHDAMFKSWYGIDCYALWWLRTPSGRATRTSVMGDYISGKDVKTNMGVAVRPALWINLNSDYFGGEFEELVIEAEPEVTVIDLIALLKEKYSVEEKPSTIDEFEKQNSKYAQQLKDLKNTCSEQFGMTYGAFLKYSGFLRDKAEELENYDPTDMVEALKLKYKDSTEKPKTVEDLIKDNPEYEEELKMLGRFSQQILGDSLVRYLKNLGIMYSAEDTALLKQKQAEEKAAQKAAAREIERSKVVDKLKIRDAVLANKVVKLFERLEELYPEHKVFALDSIDDTARENLSKYAKEIGYSSADDMLLAYGFEKINGDEVREVRPTVKYAPGREPAVIKNRVDSVLRRLEEYYPSRRIEKSIQTEHKKLSQSISGVYQWLGYANPGEFLTAYGYESSITYNDKGFGGGRPSSTNEDEVIAELKKRCGGTPYPGMKELKEANPDLAGKLKTIQNKSMSAFGMGFAAYLKQEGIIGERPKAEPVAKPVKAPKEKKKSTISRTALPVLEEKFATGKFEDSFEEVVERLEGLTVKLITATNYISVTGSARTDEILDIPCGVDSIDARAFVGRKEIKRVILSHTVCLVDRKAFEDCTNLTEVIINNPECKIAPDAFIGCNNIQIKIDRTSVIEKYLRNINAKEKDDYAKCISILEKCFETAGGRPEGFWAGNEWKFAFTIGDIMYQTTLDPVYGDYAVIDNILESVFGYERVKGTIDYFKDLKSGSDVISKTIELDENGNKR